MKADQFVKTNSKKPLQSVYQYFDLPPKKINSNIGLEAIGFKNCEHSNLASNFAISISVKFIDSAYGIATKAIEELWLSLYESFTKNAYRKELFMALSEEKSW